jgi:hypothetical protein
MTRDEIIKMARETEVEAYAPTCMAAESYSEFLSRLERFAALVAAAEREACAKRLEAVGCDHCAANIRAREEK